MSSPASPVQQSLHLQAPGANSLSAFLSGARRHRGSNRRRLKGKQNLCQIWSRIGERLERLTKRRKKKKQLVIGGRRGPSLRSSGCMCAHQASHGDAVNHCSAPHTLTGTHLVHLASSKHFCASSWDSCQLADCNQRARWPNAAPKVVQGFLFKLVRHS